MFLFLFLFMFLFLFVLGFFFGDGLFYYSLFPLS